MWKTKGLEYLKKEFGDDSDRPSPLVSRHAKRLIFIMSTIGCWPHNVFGRPRLHTFLSAYNAFLIVVAATFSILAGGYLKQHWDGMTFFDMGHIILTICLNSIYMTRLMQARTRKFSDAIKHCFFDFHLFYYKERSKYCAKIYSEIHILSGVFTVYIMILRNLGTCLFVLKPVISNYRSGMFSSNPPPNRTFEHSVYFYFPTDVFYTTQKGHWILFAINLPNNYNVTCGVFGFDLLIILVVLQIYGHLKIMKHDLLSIPMPKNGDMFSAEENHSVAQLLKDIIIHHRVIIQFVDKFSEAFQEYLFLFYFFLQIISCVLLFEVSSLTSDALAMYGPLTFAMFEQLMLLSSIFEILNSKSEELQQVVYAIPWECMDKRNRKTVLIILSSDLVQTPISLKAGGMVPVGVKTMTSILRSSITYYMMLMAVEREQ